MSSTEARKKGIRACMDKIGYEFCIKHQDGACVTYGENNGEMFCFVGIDDTAEDCVDSDVLTLSNVKGFPYSASCNVNMKSGEIKFLSYDVQ